MGYGILESYLKSHSLVQHQIEGFNRFIDIGIQNIIDEQKVIEPNVEGFALKLGKVRIDKPSVIEADSSRRIILPNEARLRNMTYAAPVFLEFIPVIRGIEKPSSYGEVFIGELPIMVGSKLCNLSLMAKSQLISNMEDPNDPGGYFIVKGTERVLIGLEDLAPNKIITTKEKSGALIVSKVFSTSINFRAKCTVSRNQHGIFSVNFPTSPTNVDFILMLRALGMKYEEMLEALSSIDVIRNDMLLNMDFTKAKELSVPDAVLELGKLSAPSQASEYQQKRSETQMDVYLLPHMGSTPEFRKEKAKYLIEMARRASLVANKYVKQDDKDHYSNKRVKFSGKLMEDLFANAFKFFVKDVKYQIERASARGRRMSIQTIISPDTLTEKLLYAMGTGTWVAGQTGVSQVLDRTNLASTYAHLRRVKSPLAKKHPHFRARDVHGTQWGKICPSESPEGQEVGLTKYIALMSKITIGSDERFIEKRMKEILDISEDK
jgi:DNA-directed RNA polymerase subunit B"